MSKCTACKGAGIQVEGRGRSWSRTETGGSSHIPLAESTPWLNVIDPLGSLQVRLIQLAPGMVQQTQGVCSDCRGEGEVIPAKDRCRACAGKKKAGSRAL